MAGPWEQYATDSPKPWEKYASEPDVTEDVLKSAGIGVPKGLTNIVGMPGDITSLIKAVFQKEANKYPGPMGDIGSIGLRMPTSGDIQGLLEKGTGPWYSPKTTPGKYAQAATEGAASMPIGVGGMGVGALTGLGSQLGLQLTGDNPIGALGGGLITGALPAGLRAIGGRATQRLREATSGMKPEDWDAAVARQKNAQSQGVNVTGPESLNDTNLLAQQRILENTPGTAGVFDRFFAPRFDQVKGALSGVLASISPQSPDPLRLGTQIQGDAQAALDRARQGANTLAKPSYDASVNRDFKFGTPGYVQADVPIELRQDGIYRQAANAVLNDPTYKLVKGDSMFSAPVMDAAKKWINAQIEAAKTAGDSAKAAAYQATLNKVVGPKGYADQMYPDYGVARDIRSRVMQSESAPRLESLTGKLANTEDPIQQFNTILDARTARTQSIVQAARDLKGGSAENYSQLVRTGLENEFDDAAKMLQQGGREFAGARFVRAMRETPQGTENVETMLRQLPNGELRVRAFNNVLDAMETTGNRMPSGSATAFNELQKSEMTSQGLVKMIANPTAPLGVLDRMSYQATASRLAEVFTDPNSVQLIQKIAMEKPGSAKLQTLLATMLSAQSANKARN